MRPRYAAGIVLMLLAGEVAAQHTDTPPAPACVEVEVNGQRIEDYACLSRMLAPAPVESTRPAPELAADALARAAPTALGLAHREATRQRMGNAFGRSTIPQRPQPPPPTLPPALRKP